MRRILSLGSLIILGLWPCSKLDETQQSNSAENLRKSLEHGVQWKINCTGSCANCDMLKVDDWGYQCNCDQDCKLQAIRIGSQPEINDAAAWPILDSLFEVYGTFRANLEESLSERLALPHTKILSVEVFSIGEWFGLLYQVRDLDSDLELSLAYYRTAPGAPGYEVDCSGDCISASMQCVEEITLGDPVKFNCSCEGSCHMTIIPIQEPE